MGDGTDHHRLIPDLLILTQLPVITSYNNLSSTYHDLNGKYVIFVQSTSQYNNKKLKI